MNERMLESLGQRLDVLERHNSRLKRLAAGLFIAVVAAVVMGQAMPSRAVKAIEAQQFVVRDVKGNTRAILGLNEAGEVQLLFTDSNKQPRIFLRARDEESGLAFFPKRGNSRSVFSDRGIWLIGGDGKVRAELTLDNDQPSLAIFEKDGKPRFNVQLLEDGDPKVTLVDKNGSNRAVLGILKGHPVIVLTNPTGKIIWNAP